jgi:hypothetical protein
MMNGVLRERGAEFNTSPRIKPQTPLSPKINSNHSKVPPRIGSLPTESIAEEVIAKRIKEGKVRSSAE